MYKLYTFLYNLISVSKRVFKFFKKRIFLTNLLSISDALKDILSGLNQPVISEYQLSTYIYNLYKKKSYKSVKLNIKTSSPENKEFNINLKTLKKNGILTDFNLPKVYKIFGKNILSEEEVICSIDPFSYISHLSAMEYHGLTDRIPRIIFYSSPGPKNWREFAKEKVLKDYDGDTPINPKGLTLINIKKFGKKHINKYNSIHMGAFIKIKDKSLRVATIGRVFLDMLKKPSLCGGIHHVIEIFEEYGEQYLELIVSDIDTHGNKIDKVRAGYILDEICSIEHNILNKWIKESVQRGGSRRLDPDSEYSSTFSEKWCLSINTGE